MKITPKILIATVLLLWLAGCSLADMAYNNAPLFVAEEFDDAFDLTEMQSSQLDLRLEQFFIWHRQEELGRYQDFLERAARAAADGIKASEFLLLRKDVIAAWERSLTKGIDSLGDLSVNLTPGQIESFERYFYDKSEKYRDYLEKSVQQREIDRVDRNFARIENWFGEFDYQQQQKIRQLLRQMPDIYEPWIEYREQRHQALIEAMQQGMTGQQLKTIMLDPSTDHARAFDPVRETYWRAYAHALEDIGSWLSERQRQHAVDRLQRYARIVERLRGDS